MRRRALPGLASLLLPAAAAAQPAPLRVLATGAVEHALHDLLPGFTAAGGPPTALAIGNAGAVARRLRQGEAADLVINSAGQVAALQADGLLRPGTARELGRMRIGLAVRRGTPAPAIASVAELRAALLAAPALALSDPATGATTGVHLFRLMQDWGVLGTLRPRLQVFPQGTGAVQAVARGEAALVMTQISEILADSGVTLVAPLPEAANLVTPYAGAIAATATDAAGAAALLRHLTAEPARARFRQDGFATD